MHPQSNQLLSLLQAARGHQQYSLDDASKVTEIEDVMTFGRRWQETLNRLLVDFQCGLHHHLQQQQLQSTWPAPSSTATTTVNVAGSIIYSDNNYSQCGRHHHLQQQQLLQSMLPAPSPTVTIVPCTIRALRSGPAQPTGLNFSCRAWVYILCRPGLNKIKHCRLQPGLGLGLVE